MSQINPYRAIADANRRKILDLLRTAGPLRAGDIVDHLPHISQPAVSKHLRVLHQAQLVYDMQEGRERWYYLSPAPLHPVALWLKQYETLWENRLDTLKQVIEQGPRVTRPWTPEAAHDGDSSQRD